jgi:ribosomal protein L15
MAARSVNFAVAGRESWSDLGETTSRSSANGRNTHNKGCVEMLAEANAMARTVPRRGFRKVATRDDWEVGEDTPKPWLETMRCFGATR